MFHLQKYGNGATCFFSLFIYLFFVPFSPMSKTGLFKHLFESYISGWITWYQAAKLWDRFEKKPPQV